MWAQVAQAVGSVAGGLIGAKAQQKANRQNIKLQKEFAQTGIRWKVEDAKKAGIHPLYALGANTHSFSPVSVGDGGAAHFAQAGQDIGRAIHATRTGGERMDAYTAASQKLALQRGELENALLASQLAKINQPGTPPARPTLTEGTNFPGQGDVKLKPHETTASSPTGFREAGVMNETGYHFTGTGWAPTMSDDFKQRSEEDPWAVVGHWVRNRVPQSFQMRSSYKPPFPAPGGHYWAFHPGAQEYRLKKYVRGAGRFSAPQGSLNHPWR